MNTAFDLWVLVLTACLSIIGTLLMRRYAVRRQMLDVPNQRSLHKKPTPRGGGLAIIIAFYLALSILFISERIGSDLFIALLGGLLVAGVSFWDDHKSLSNWLRLSIHFSAGAWALYWLGGMAPLDLGFASWTWGPLRQGLALLGLVWLINLYNFMDGIDGLAASQAIYVAITAMCLLGWQSDLGAVLALLGAACAGFLVFNWPPARIFMGDIGSCFLGYCFAVMALASAARQTLPIWCWVILLAVFFSDTTVTLLRRIAHKERWYEAHRSHAYQRLAQRINSHAKVTLLVLLINLLWLLPLALASTVWPKWAFVISLLAILPLVIAVWWQSADRSKT